MMTYIGSQFLHRTGRASMVVAGVALGAALFVALSALGNGFREAARAPLAGALSLSSWARQHIRRPHIPEIRLGFSDSFCVLAMRIVTELKRVMNVAQHRVRPQGPHPPLDFA